MEDQFPLGGTPVRCHVSGREGTQNDSHKASFGVQVDHPWRVPGAGAVSHAFCTLKAKARLVANADGRVVGDPVDSDLEKLFLQNQRVSVKP